MLGIQCPFLRPTDNDMTRCDTFPRSAIEEMDRDSKNALDLVA